MTWTRLSDIPGGSSTSIREHGATAIGTKLYVTGGFLPNVFLGPPGAFTWEYDEPTDTWTSLANMPAARAGHGCAALSGLVYVAGGRTVGSVQSNLYEYDPGTDTWTSRASLPAARYGVALVAVGGNLYAFGGSNTIGPTTAQATVYQWSPDSWTAMTSMPAARLLAGSAVVGTDVWIFGGLDSTNTETDTVWRYDTLTDTWDTSYGPAPITNQPFGMAVERTTDVLVCGGFNGGIPLGSPTQSILYQYDTLTDAWTTLDPLPVFRQVVTNAGTPSYFYVIAGWSGSSTENTLYRWNATGTTTTAGWSVDVIYF